MTNTPKTLPHIRVDLDAIGGVAGDMFVAAISGLRPDLPVAVDAQIAKLAPPASVSARTEPTSDGVLTGTRFVVTDESAPRGDGSGDPHTHTSWSAIRQLLENADLDPEVRGAALAIFSLLADAEAHVHGIAPEDVTFHEVGAWDSIIDIVASATLITRLSPRTWRI
ncbi:MAG: nickel insertion protein, partial [Pseudomonadota bacterium]